MSTEEVVEVKRKFYFTPLKLVAIILGCISGILLIASIAGDQWLFDEKNSSHIEGLWDDCRIVGEKCKHWLSAVQAFMILTLLLDVVATAITAWAYFQNFITEVKWYFYRLATAIFGGALLFAIIGLSIYIGMTLHLLNKRKSKYWHVGWAHGLGWSSVILLVVIIVLLVLPTEKDAPATPKAAPRSVHYYDNAGHI